MADNPLNWGGDAPSTGAFQSHQVAEFFKPASYDAVFYQLADKKVLASGDELTIPSYSNLTLPSVTTVGEMNRLPTIKLSLNSKVISTSENGLKMVITDLMKRRSPVDVAMASKDELALLMKRQLEKVCKQALDDTPIKYVATSATAQNIDVDGSATGTLASQPNVYHLRRLSTYMQDNLRIPFHQAFQGYAGVFRYNAIENIMNDTDFSEVNTTAGDSVLGQLQVKRIASINIIGYNDGDILSGAIGTSSLYSEGLILGKQAVCFVSQDLPQMYYDFSVDNDTDFGRFNYIAWRGNFGAGLYSDSGNAGLARSVHWTTA